jgi:hypothetical protein
MIGDDSAECQNKRRQIMAVNVAKLAEALKTTDVSDFAKFDRLISEKFPDATVEEVGRALEIMGSDLRADVEQAQREEDRSLALLSIFDGLEDRGLTLTEAAKIKAAQGDPMAISLLKHLNSRTYRLHVALLRAATSKRPDLWKPHDKGIAWLGKGEPPDDYVLIDEFQMKYPAEARAIEAAIDADD